MLKLRWVNVQVRLSRHKKALYFKMKTATTTRKHTQLNQRDRQKERKKGETREKKERKKERRKKKKEEGKKRKWRRKRGRRERGYWKFDVKTPRNRIENSSTSTLTLEAFLLQEFRRSYSFSRRRRNKEWAKIETSRIVTAATGHRAVSLKGLSHAPAQSAGRFSRPQPVYSFSSETTSLQRRM